MDESFDECHITSLNDIDHPVLIEQQKQYIDVDDYEKF